MHAVLAFDLLAVFKRERSCPLCGAIRPKCSHVLAAEKIAREVGEREAEEYAESMEDARSY